MNGTPSIIVYRNPMEAYFWENGLLFPVIGICVVFFVAFLISIKIIDIIAGLTNKRRGGYVRRGYLENNKAVIATVISTICCGLAFHFFAVGI